MSTYLKHMGGYKHKQLMGKSYDEIQKLFDKEMKRVNTFVAMSSEAQESNEKKEEVSEEKAKGSKKKMLGRKRVGKEQQQESSKKQRMEEDKESDEVEEDDEAELKKLLVIKKDDDIAIDVIPLATKPLVIVDYKLRKEGIMVNYQLIRADGSSKKYSLMIRLLQGIDREDLETLCKLVKTKHGDIRPEDEHEKVMWGDFKVMFKPNIEVKFGEIYKVIQCLFGNYMIHVEYTLPDVLSTAQAYGKAAKGSIKGTRYNEKKEDGSEEKAKGNRKKMLGRKRTRKEQQQESSKKQRMEEDKETDEVEEDDEAELKKHLVIKQDDDIAINAIPLATKPPVIVDYKLLKEGIMGIDREDLLTLWKLVKTKHGEIRPENDHERVMWGDFKVMFKPDIRSKVWRDLQVLLVEKITNCSETFYWQEDKDELKR
ncbi:hypothetical protein Tco_0635227 [Tanacetum coccineum]